MTQLHYKLYPNNNKRHLIILHGLLGSSDNWRTICKQLQADFNIICPDCRNHGQSFHSATMSYTDMATDIINLISALDIAPCYIIGHSMGGKIAMNCLQQQPTAFKKALIVDIAPKAYNHQHQNVFEAIQSLTLSTMQQRTDIINQLSTFKLDIATQQLILKNIGRNQQQQFYWKPNINALSANYTSVMNNSTTNQPITTPTLFLAGEQSTYIQHTDYPIIHQLFKRAQITEIAGVGHWLQAEKPILFCEKATDFFKST